MGVLVATLLRTLLGRAPEPQISRYALEAYIRDLTNAQLGFGGFSSSATVAGRPAEEIENSFTGYTYGAYKRNGVIFAVILSRLLLFTEARFGFRPVGKKVDTTAT